MRKLISFFALFCILFLNVASMCSADDNMSTTNPSPVIALITDGTWRVNSYIDAGNDKTAHFTGYDFTFSETQVLTASNGSDIYTGTWSVTSDNDDDDSPGGDLDFDIVFTAPADFADLTEDWNVVTYSSTTITLVHLSGGDGTTDTLVLEKN